jgi:hypothetical protein
MSHQYPAYSSDRAAAVQPMSNKTAAADTMLMLEQEIVAALSDADVKSSEMSLPVSVEGAIAMLAKRKSSILNANFPLSVSLRPPIAF